MAIIRAVYSREPNFPATDQHPQAKRFQFDGQVIDAIGDLTEAEFTAWRLDQAKAAATAEVERLAETRRETLTSAGAGKRDAYLLKYELLLRAIKEDPDQEAIGLLSTEATARGTTLEALGLLIAAKRKAWEQAAMAIETAEATHKGAVSAASDRDAVAAAVDAARAAFDAIGG